MSKRANWLFVLVLLISSPWLLGQPLDSCPQTQKGLYIQPDAPTWQKVAWAKLILQCIPVLEHDPGDRWPMIIWPRLDLASLSDDELLGLKARGLVPHLRLRAENIASALRLQKLAIPVVILETAGGNWPYNLLENDQWKAKFPAEQAISQNWLNHPVILDLAAFRFISQQYRAVLQQFLASGVSLDAFWFDLEGQPLAADFQAVKASSASQVGLPKAALQSAANFYRYRRQIWAQLMSTYVAAPIREFYPNASITNWVFTQSSHAYPVKSWDGWGHPVLGPTLFSATNPIAYAADEPFVKLWPQEQTYSQALVDQVYLHIMLRQVSPDAWNRHRDAPHLQAIPWVARWVPDLGDAKIPVMSREAYREALRHLWLRDIDGMQIFNAERAGYLAPVFAEVADAVAVYDEMLEFRDFLEHGEMMVSRTPDPFKASVLWSGLRLGERAIIRIVRLGAAPKRWRIKPFKNGSVVALPAEIKGATYLLERDPKTGEVEVLNAVL